MLRTLWLSLLLCSAPTAAQELEEIFVDLRSELMLAIEMDDLAATRQEIEEGALFEINQGDPSPLYTAVELDNLRMVALLLHYGGDPSSTRDSPLEMALRNDNPEMVDLLLAAGAEVPGSSSQRELLALALRGGHAALHLGKLLDRGASPDLALRLLVENHQEELVELCVERGANVATLPETLNLLEIFPAQARAVLVERTLDGEHRGEVLSYFLGAAAALGDRATVDLVLERGAQANVDHLRRAALAGQDEIALHLLELIDVDLADVAEQARTEGDERFAAFLDDVRRRRALTVFVPVAFGLGLLFLAGLGAVSLRRVIRHSPRRLHEAVHQGDVDRARQMVQAGADVHGWHAGRQALHVATANDDLKLARTLLHHGASPDSPAQDDAALTPLHQAAANGSIALAELLLRHGAEVDARDGDGLPPLFHAASCGHAEMVAFLLERGADVQAQAGSESLLARAIGRKDRTAASILLDAGADPNADQGRTALHAAVAMGDAELVGELLRHAPRLQVHDANGRTPLALAQFLGRLEIVELLERAGARA